MPSLAEAVRPVDDEHHRALQVGDPSDDPGFDESLAIDRLAPELPDDTVCNCGGAVAIRNVIAEVDAPGERMPSFLGFPAEFDDGGRMPGGDSKPPV